MCAQTGTTAQRPRSRDLPAGLSAVLGLVVGFGAILLIGLIVGSGRLAGKSDAQKALRVLRADQADLARLTDAVASARRVKGLAAAGTGAAQVVEVMRVRDARLSLLEDREVA